MCLIAAKNVRNEEKRKREKFRVEVGKILQDLRREKGVSRVDVARATGLLHQTIHYMETSGKGQTLENILAIGESLSASESLMAQIIEAWRSSRREAA